MKIRGVIILPIEVDEAEWCEEYDVSDVHKDVEALLSGCDGGLTSLFFASGSGAQVTGLKLAWTREDGTDEVVLDITPHPYEAPTLPQLDYDDGLSGLGVRS